MTFSVINARCGDTYQYVSSCAYSRWIYHIEFSHKLDTPFFLLGFPFLQFATFACNNTAAFEPTKDKKYRNGQSPDNDPYIDIGHGGTLRVAEVESLLRGRGSGF